MAKKFNVTGLCFPDIHYMADVSGKIAQIKKMVDKAITSSLIAHVNTGKRQHYIL